MTDDADNDEDEIDPLLYTDMVFGVLTTILIAQNTTTYQEVAGLLETISSKSQGALAECLQVLSTSLRDTEFGLNTGFPIIEDTGVN